LIFLGNLKMTQTIGLIFLGPPGSGKGTQAQLLSELFGLLHISTGDILRKAIAQKTPLGEKAQSYVERGDLVPDQLLLDLISHTLKSPPAKQGWILDGFPRTVPQAIFLDELLQQFKDSSLRVIDLEVPDEIIVERLLSRKREDDSEDIIRHRLTVYYQKTAPVLDYYRAKGSLHSVDGNRQPQDVTASLQEIIKA